MARARTSATHRPTAETRPLAPFRSSLVRASQPCMVSHTHTNTHTHHHHRHHDHQPLLGALRAGSSSVPTAVHANSRFAHPHAHTVRARAQLYPAPPGAQGVARVHFPCAHARAHTYGTRERAHAHGRTTTSPHHTLHGGFLLAGRTSGLTHDGARHGTARRRRAPRGGGTAEETL